MADKLENALSAATPALVRALDSAGNSINSDLITLASAMPVATAYIKGVMSAADAISLNNVNVVRGVAGGEQTRWFRIALLLMEPYSPCWIRLSYGIWNSVERNNLDVIITYGTSDDIIISGSANNMVGYTLNSEKNTMSIYFKCTIGMSVVGQVLCKHQTMQNYTKEEPSGIVYIP